MPVPCLIYHHGKGSTRFATKALVQSSAVLWGLNKKQGEDKQRIGKASTPLALGINWATSAAILLHCILLSIFLHSI